MPDTNSNWGLAAGNYRRIGLLHDSTLSTSGGTIHGNLTITGGLTVAGTTALDGSTATTPATADNSTAIATTAWVKAQGYGTGGGGGVTSITAGTGLSGGTITTTGTIALANTAVVAGTYQGITFNAQGQATAAVNQSYLTGNQTITLSGDVSGSGTTAITTTLPTVNASPGATAHASLTTNAKGLVTANSVGNHTGDVTSVGLATTLATVNANVGTFQGITVNAKGLVTAAVNQGYVTSSGVTSLVAGTGLTGGTITTTGTMALSVPVLTANGGTGQTTLTANAVLVGNGTSAITSSAITSDNGTTLRVSTNQVIGTAVTAPPANSLVVNAAATTPQAVSVTPQLWLAADSANAVCLIDAYGTAPFANLIGRKSRGTPASPSALLSGDVIAALQTIGRGATTYGAAATALLVAAAEAWSDTAQGTLINVVTTTPGSTTTGTRMQIRQGVIIGTGADPGQNNLSVVGNASIAGSGVQYTALGSTNAIGMSWNNRRASHVSGYIDSTYVGDFAWFADISDSRLKRDVQPYTAGLAEVELLDPVSWQWNGEVEHYADDGVRHYGLLADAVAAILPEATGTREGVIDGETVAIATLQPTALIWPLINAVKELSARVAALEAKAA
jgi:hypothetical protein